MQRALAQLILNTLGALDDNILATVMGQAGGTGLKRRESWTSWPLG